MITGVYIGTWRSWRQYHDHEGFEWNPNQPTHNGWLVLTGMNAIEQMRGCTISPEATWVMSNDPGFYDGPLLVAEARRRVWESPS